MSLPLYIRLTYLATFLLLWCPIHVFASFPTELDTSLRTYYGRVLSGTDGVANVAVSDGIQVTLTDSAGCYQLCTTSAPHFIFISLPSGFASRSSSGEPSYYKRTNPHDGNQRIDFDLPKLGNTEDQHTLIVGADPQVAFDEELPQLDSLLLDMKLHVEHAFADNPVYGIVLGDMVGDLKQTSPSLADIRRRFDSTHIPFFYVAGNHDLDLDIRSHVGAKLSYEAEFGPRYYSFNRGKVHYIVLDDVFSTGRAYGYIGYLEEQQLQWLEQDLALIPPGNTVIVSLHIPTYSVAARKGEYNKEDIKKTLQNRQALYRILKPYNTHIFSAHEHYHENYVIHENLFEHVHSALSGIFWQAPYNSDGTPLGYTVYEIDGDQLSWYFKAANRDKSEQLVSYLPGTDKNKPEAIVANVWNYDPEWKVFWYEDGIKMGEMKASTGWDADVVGYVKANQQQFRYPYVGAGPTEHLFYAVPKNKNAKLLVEVVDRFQRRYYSTPK